MKLSRVGRQPRILGAVLVPNGVDFLQAADVLLPQTHSQPHTRATGRPICIQGRPSVRAFTLNMICLSTRLPEDCWQSKRLVGDIGKTRWELSLFPKSWMFFLLLLGLSSLALGQEDVDQCVPDEDAAPCTAESVVEGTTRMPLPKIPDSVSAFLDRVFQHIPTGTITGYRFRSWTAENKPTEEGVGIKPIAGASPDKLFQRIMDVDHYVGNIDHISACRGVKDSRFNLPQAIRFYQKVTIPVVGDVQHELVLADGGERRGYRLVYWYILTKETNMLTKEEGYRSNYNVGAWLLKDGIVGYALSSAPKREDVGWITWKALTIGADLSASPVVEDSIDGMTAWAAKLK